MKRNILLILFIFISLSTVSFSEPSTDGDKTNTVDLQAKYRAYPFQWIFPEYYYQAEVIRLEKEKKVPQGYTEIEFFGLSACIPSSYTFEIKRKNDILLFKTKAGDVIMMIKSQDSSMLCSEENQYHMKDYCSAFKTVQEYNHKLFTLTPKTAQSVGDKWIVHDKGGVFENAKKVEIYSDDLFVAYVKVIKDSLVIDKKINYSHEITLFHANGPLNAHIIISFTAKDDTLMKHFLSTIK